MIGDIAYFQDFAYDLLVENDRLTSESAQKLVVDVESCGPFAARAA